MIHENITPYVAYWLGCYHVQSLHLKTEVNQVMGDNYNPLPEVKFLLEPDGNRLFVWITIVNVPRGYGSKRRLMPALDEKDGQSLIAVCQDFIAHMILDKWEF